MTQASQREIDIWRRFKPTPSQLRFFKSRARGRLFSSGYGSGKSLTGCREGIRWTVQYAGCRGLIGRLVGDELKTTTMVTFWKSMDTIGFREAATERDMRNGGGHYVHNKSERFIDFWNGSRIYYRHLDDPGSLGSLELNWAFIDEGSEVDDEIYKTISSSRLRWHLPSCDQVERVHEMIDAGASDEEIMAVPCDCPYGIWVCTNPGASGYLRAVTRGDVPDWEWIKAKPGDNPYNGPDYYAKMERDRKINGEVWFKKFYNGDWTAFAGQRFPMFDEQRHILKERFVPTPEHECILGLDFGHRETFVSWIAFKADASEPVVVFDELQVQEVDEPSQVADKIKEINAMYGLKHPIILGDPAGVAANQFSSVSPIQAYGALGVHITPCKAGKNPQSRADLLTEFLQGEHRMYDGTAWPGIVFAPNCTATVHSIVNLRWKPQTGKLGEDPREVFLKKDDHGFDALTYGLVGVPPPSLPPRRAPRSPNVNISAREALAELG